MKKRLLAVLLVITMSLSTFACGSKAETSEESKTSESSEGSQSVEVDENLLTMEITIPADYMENKTQEDLDKAVSENGFISATLNDDGSATYVMTKGTHKKYMKELKDEFDKTLSELIESEEYPNFTNVEVNDDFTNFSITTKSSELGFDEAFSVIIFYMYGGLYNSFNGTPVDNVHVEFVNADSGEVISSSDSKDLAEESQ